MNFSRATLALAHHLQLDGALSSGRGPAYNCHGYQNLCTCPECLALGEQIDARGFAPDGKLNPPKSPKQPWQIAA